MRILHNLLSNAQKFAKEGTEVEIKVVEMPEGMAKVRVLNEGISIPQAWQERIFEK
ncbi:MAG: ATP-binding protein [Flammeovirgaceae bacterium]